VRDEVLENRELLFKGWGVDDWGWVWWWPRIA
jgi:hypothetical protein